MGSLRNVQASSSGDILLDNICYFPPYGDADVRFCAELPIQSSEFYQAGIHDIKPTVLLLIDTESDDVTVKKLKYNDTVYSIYRRYDRPSGRTEIYTEIRAGVDE